MMEMRDVVVLCDDDGHPKNNKVTMDVEDFRRLLDLWVSVLVPRKAIYFVYLKTLSDYGWPCRVGQ
jgi:hypothetical protein